MAAPTATRESQYLTLPNRRACPTVVPAKVYGPGTSVTYVRGHRLHIIAPIQVDFDEVVMPEVDLVNPIGGGLGPDGDVVVAQGHR